jgi:hypothetical protein
MNAIEATTLFAVAGFFLYLVQRSPVVAFCLLSMLVGANGLFVDVGVSLSASRLLIVAFLPWAILRLVSPGGAATLSGTGGITISLLAYVLIVTAGSNAFFLPPIAGVHSDFREEYRWAIQWVSFLNFLLPLLLAPLTLRTKEDGFQALRWFIYGTAALCALALVQWLAAQFFNVAIFGIARGGVFGGEFQSSFFVSGDREIYRANGLAREPKDLAAIAAIALVALALFGLPGIVSRMRVVVTSLLLCAGLLVTFATTGAVLVLLGAGVVLLGTRLRTKSGPKSFGIYSLLAVAMCLLLASFLAADFWSRVIEERITTRLGGLEDYDQVALDFLLDNPGALVTGVGAGLLPYYASGYMPNDPSLLEYMWNFTWDAKAGGLKWLTSFGLVGCLLGVLLLMQIFRILGRYLPREGVLARRDAILFLTYISTVNFIRASDEVYWVLAGILIAISRGYGLARQPAKWLIEGERAALYSRGATSNVQVR